jgi:4-amino-4-deoxy-L-arabinose transferase-like glycosyltransferase
MVDRDVWAGFALAFLTKGPPALLPLLALLAFDWLMPGRQRHRLFQWSGIVLFVCIAPALVLRGRDAQSGAARILRRRRSRQSRGAATSFGRHGEWYGWRDLSCPRCWSGTLPWTPTAAALGPARCRRMRAVVARSAQRDGGCAVVCCCVWVLLPLIVFCIARSRMPLYLLPLFAPLALLVACSAARRRPCRARAGSSAWAACVLGLQVAGASGRRTRTRGCGRRDPRTRRRQPVRKWSSSRT